MNPSIIKSHRAASAVAGYTILKAAAPGDDTTVAPAAAADDPLVGVADMVGAAEGAIVDVHIGGLYEVRLGGAVSFGDPLTAGADGKAVAAAAAAGETRRVIGYARAAGVADDIIPLIISPGLLHEPAGE